MVETRERSGGGSTWTEVDTKAEWVCADAGTQEGWARIDVETYTGSA